MMSRDPNCFSLGVNTIYTICGPEYANEILLGGNSEFQWTWRASPHYGASGDFSNTWCIQVSVSDSL
jgi:hypothetical protein